MDKYIVGVDVGGTFTDLVIINTNGKAPLIAKVPSTLNNQACGVLSALHNTGVALPDVEVIVHGTTTTTNAVLERKLSKVGLITTKGFRDVLELGRRTRPSAYGLKGSFIPLVARELRMEVDERMDSRGNVYRPLNEKDVTAACRKLLEAGAESLVIHFLHSYINGHHEKQAAYIASKIWPNNYITTGHSILSEYREYERGVTAAVNGAVQPILDTYIELLSTELRNRGYHKDLLVMQGNGGTVSASVVSDAAVNTVMSGPASGIIAAARISTEAGFRNVITYDMGGTSSDVALIKDGVPQISSELELEYAMPIHVPMVDVHTIGAGGGSIAGISDSGILQVGPESAGATPGPICYGRGGTRPTITDANMVLGRLNPNTLLAVNSPVTLDYILEDITRTIGKPLGLSGYQAANAILEVANNNMAGALRMVSIARGQDPRDCALFAFGGAGPLHVIGLARELSIPRAIIPVRPGLTSAIGCIVADIRHDYVNTINAPLDSLNMKKFKSILESQKHEGNATIKQEGVEILEVRVTHEADMQFVGQSHVLTITIPDLNIDRSALRNLFQTAYWERFAVELDNIKAAVISLRTSVIGLRKNTDLSTLSLQYSGGEIKPVTTRKVWFKNKWHETPIYSRENLSPGTKLSGPAIVEQLDTTSVIEPNCSVSVDGTGNMIVTIEEI